MALSASFIEGAAGRILLTCHEADAPSRRAVIVLPAFGEEMNKSRRLVRDTAARLSASGYLVVVPDLFGCGDSDGVIEDARMDIWVNDLRAVLSWIKNQGMDQLSVIAVRAGAMFLEPLLADWTFRRVIGWQPINGADTLRGLLRIRSLNLRMSGKVPGNAATMQNDLLSEGARTALSGYTITSGLAADMMHTTTGFSEVFEGCTAVHFGHGPSEPGKVVVSGERFWQVLEPGPNDELVATTVRLLASQ